VLDLNAAASYDIRAMTDVSEGLDVDATHKRLGRRAAAQPYDIECTNVELGQRRPVLRLHAGLGASVHESAAVAQPEHQAKWPRSPGAVCCWPAVPGAALPNHTHRAMPSLSRGCRDGFLRSVVR
jgi:hypothetical protein